MIGVSARPSSSSAARIAPTRPSIMSLGATTSAPARAWLTAVRASSSSEASLSTVPSSPQQAAVAVARVLAEAHVGDDEQVGVRVLDRARGELDDALVVPRPGALLVLVRRDAEQRAPRAGRSAARLARLAHGLVEIDSRSTPGIASIGLRPLEAGLDEHRQHEVGGLEARLAHQVAQRRRPAQTPQAGAGEGHALSLPPSGRRAPVAGACLPVLGGQRVERVVLPDAGDPQVAQRAALAAEADLLRDPAASARCGG